MDVMNSIKNVAKNINVGNLVMVAVIPAIGVAVNYGVKKIVEHEMKKNTAKEAYTKTYSSFEQQEDNQTVNFTFGTGKSPIEDEELRKERGWNDEPLYPYERRNNDENKDVIIVRDIEEVSKC